MLRRPVAIPVAKFGARNLSIERGEETLILKRDPDARYTESYNILFEGRHVGRIYKAVSHAPREAPSWFWGLDFFEWQGGDGPQYGNVANQLQNRLPRRVGSEPEGERKK